MKFKKEDLQYLNGIKFSNGHKFKVAKKNQPNKRRIEFLTDFVKNKKVLHIGFTDHVPLIEQKVKSNDWLHKLLIDSSNHCVGIDINTKSVDYVKKVLGIKNVYSLDIATENLPQQIKTEEFDVVILGEVLEHIDNPVNFLNQINIKLSKQSKQLIVTVPNALDLTNLLEIGSGIEYINTDHRYWFTPFTLSKVLSRANFKIEDFFYLQSWMPKRKWKRFLVKRYPMLRETLVLVSSFN